MHAKIRLSKPHINNKQNLMNMIEKIIDSGFLVGGKYVSELEKEVSSYLDIKYAIAVSSGTAALHLSLLALEIGQGDEVIVPAYTFPATANVVELVGAKPTLVDVNLDSYNIQVNKIEAAISKRTKAIIPVSLFGNPVNIYEILEIAKQYRIYVIEDAAGALGSEYKGKKCGTFGDIGCYSFHPRKIITTAEGGMVVTNNDELAKKVQRLRNHGIQKTNSLPDFVEPGFNYRMNDLEAVLGLTQIHEITSIIRERQELSKFYIDFLKKNRDISFQKILSGSTTTWQTFAIRLKHHDINSVLVPLKSLGIEANIASYALHLLHFYRSKYNYKSTDYPNASELYLRCLALPFYNGLSRNRVKYVANMLQKLINGSV